MIVRLLQADQFMYLIQEKFCVKWFGEGIVGTEYFGNTQIIFAEHPATP